MGSPRQAPFHLVGEVSGVEKRKQLILRSSDHRLTEAEKEAGFRKHGNWSGPTPEIMLVSVSSEDFWGGIRFYLPHTKMDFY